MQTYDRRGITNLLKDYYRLVARKYYGSDFDTAVILADLMSVINSNVLTARQRQFIALYYFVGLTLDEVADVTNTTQVNVKERIYDGLRRIEGYSNKSVSADSFKARTPDNFSGKEGEVYRWLDGIADGESVGEPSRKVVLSIASLLSKTDDESAEMIRQYDTGTVYIDETEVSEEYPYYSAEQFRWLDRRITSVPEVFPVGDIVGSKKSMPAPLSEDENDDDTEEYTPRYERATGRKKLFLLRGN